jgi:hypothetical protein
MGGVDLKSSPMLARDAASAANGGKGALIPSRTSNNVAQSLRSNGMIAPRK